MNDTPEKTDSRHEDAEALVKLAKARFDDLTAAEEKLFRNTAMGEPADYLSDDPTENDPADAKDWGEERVLRAECIAWLCADRKAREYITLKGLVILGAYIVGELKSESIRFPYRYGLIYCAIPDGANFQHSLFRLFNLSGSRMGSLKADGMTVEGDVFLRNGFRATGEVRLLGATIAGDLSCVEGTFINPGGKALHADGVRVRRHVLLSENFSAVGEVRFPSATIGGNLSCVKGTFINPGGVALSADGVAVEGALFLRDGFRAEGEVRFIGASIGGYLDCVGGNFNNPDKIAIYADGLKTPGNVLFRNDFRARGEVRLPGATIGGNLECSGATLIRQGGIALNATLVTVKGDIHLRNGFNAEGKVNLIGATIAGSLDCIKGTFLNPGGYALSAHGMKVEGHVFLREGFKAKGILSFAAATIKAHFQLVGIDSDSDFFLDLDSAYVGSLWIERKSWPKKGNLNLHGAVYGDIVDIEKNAPSDATRRIDWLELQDDKEYFPQPYEQLAAVLKKNGQVVDARDVLIAKEKYRRKRGKLAWFEWPWYYLFGPMIGFGYRPLRAFLYAIIFIAVGAGLFWDGQELFAPTGGKPTAADNGEKSSLYPTFNAFMYSVDTFIPIVDFHQVKYRLPNAEMVANPDKKVWQVRSGSLLLAWFWIEVGAGWVISSLLIVGLTRFVRS